MASLITCTPGGASDNSYVTLTQADAYFANGLRRDTWLGWSTDDRERALIQATAEIEDLGGARQAILHPARPCFPGTPYDTGNTNGVADQALHFPRTTDVTTISTVVTKQIPQNVREAVCEQAYWLLEKRDAPDLLDRGEAQARGVKSVAVDGIAESYGPTRVPPGIGVLAWGKIAPFVRRSFPTA